MRRRDFVTVLVSAAAAWPLAARAQQPPMPALGLLYGGSFDGLGYLLPAFRQGLRQNGYIEGRNLAIEFRCADDHLDRVPALAEDLVRRQVNVMVAAGGGGSVAKAAKAATIAVPIVFMTNLDPVKAGLVASLNRPGGNATGYSFFGSLLEPKKLELVHELVPKAAAIGMLVNPHNPNADADVDIVRRAAEALGHNLQVVTAGTEHEFASAYAALVEKRVAAFVVASDPFFNERREQLVALSARHALPAIYEWREFVQLGGLMSYGSSIMDAWRQVGAYAGQILKGAKPDDLPVHQPTKFELVVNLKAAKTLGIEVPTAILLRADEVIE